MEKSIHQARWLLLPVFGLCFSTLALGFFAS
jgi:hypothetical protein